MFAKKAIMSLPHVRDPHSIHGRILPSACAILMTPRVHAWRNEMAESTAEPPYLWGACVINGVVIGLVFMVGLALHRHFESDWITDVTMYSMFGGAAVISGAAYRQGWKEAIKASPTGKSTGHE